MNICEPFRQTAGDIAKICDANFHHRLVLNIGEAIPWYLCMFLSFSCEWRSSVVQARMCKLGRDPLIFLKILVVIGHVCIYWSKVAEGFSVFNAVLLENSRLWLPFCNISLLTENDHVSIMQILCHYSCCLNMLWFIAEYLNISLFHSVRVFFFKQMNN